MDANNKQQSASVEEALRQRREGHPAEAVKLATEALAIDGDHERAEDAHELRVILALALLDQGETDGAIRELEAVFPPPAHSPVELDDALPSETSSPIGEFDEAELENAFLEAESHPEEMWNANHVAEATLAQVEEGAPEGIPLAADSPFATATMAGLLEEQGHADEASALRAAIGDAPTVDSPSERAQIIETLERWLDNLRRAS